VSGILAIWNDCVLDDRDHYERWYLRQHLLERVDLPGFRCGRRFEAPDAAPQFFTYYEVESPAALASPEYVARLEHPTAETRRAMASFRGMIRTVCLVAAAEGGVHGAHAVTVRHEGTLPPRDATVRLVGELAACDGIARASWWVAAGTGAPTRPVEATLRGAPDATVAGALVVECLRRGDAERVADELRGGRLGSRAGARDVVGTYSLLCDYRPGGR
jgi:hypothetical protein